MQMNKNRSMLSAVEITKTFGDTVALNNFSIEVSSSEIVGFLGPNGAGKTTMMRIMTGFLEPDSGEMLVNGQPVIKNKREVSRLIGYLPENNPLYPDMSVADLINFSCDLYGIPGSDRKKHIDDIVMQTGISSVYYRPIYQLSKGFKQRVGLAQAIVHKPDILILDEPTEGLDPNQRIEIRKLIKEVGKDKTVIFSSHVMQEVEAVCNRVIVINKGELVKDTEIGEFKKITTDKKRTFIYLELKGDNIAANIKELGIEVVEEQIDEDGTIKLKLAVSAGKDVRAAIFSLANEFGWELLEIYTEKSSLEDAFKELTRER